MVNTFQNKVEKRKKNFRKNGNFSAKKHVLDKMYFVFWCYSKQITAYTCNFHQILILEFYIHDIILKIF